MTYNTNLANNVNNLILQRIKHGGGKRNLQPNEFRYRKFFKVLHRYEDCTFETPYLKNQHDDQTFDDR